MACNFTGDTNDVNSNVTCSTTENKLNAMRLVATSAVIVGSTMAVWNIIAIAMLIQCKRMIYQIKVIAINLAVTDFSTGFFSVVDAVLAMYGLNVKYEWCVIRCHLDIMLVIASIFFMTVFALDRFLSLQFAMLYQELVSKRRIYISCILTWLLATTVTVLTYINGFKRTSPCICVDNEGHPMISLVFRNACFLTIVLVYIYLFWHVKQQNRKITALGNKPGPNMRPAMKISVIVAAVFFMYFPKNIFLLYYVLRNRYVQENLKMFAALIYIEKLNSLVNPILYAWRFKECRMYLMKSFCFWSSNMMQRARYIDYELTGSYMMASKPNNNNITNVQGLNETAEQTEETRTRRENTPTIVAARGLESSQKEENEWQVKKDENNDDEVYFDNRIPITMKY